MTTRSREGHSQAVQTLLDNRADINARDDNSTTALMIAALVQSKELVELLLKNGADPNVKAKEGVTALMLAEANPHKGVIEVLKKYGARN